MSTPKNLAGSYTHLPSPMKFYFFSVLAIVSCAVPSAIFSSWAWKAYGLEGIPLALVTVISAMVLATGLFAGLSALGKAFKITK
ncbi:MAG: hypothetical protein WCL29_05425 [Pseudomonadota bacterium]